MERGEGDKRPSAVVLLGRGVILAIGGIVLFWTWFFFLIEGQSASAGGVANFPTVALAVGVPAFEAGIVVGIVLAAVAVGRSPGRSPWKLLRWMTVWACVCLVANLVWIVVWWRAI